MYKKIFQYTLIVACIGVIGYVYYQFSKGESEPVGSYNAIPSNMAFLLEVSSFNQWGKYRSWMDELAANKNEAAGISFNPMTAWPDVISTLDSLRGTDILWSDILRQSFVVFGSTEQLRGDMWMISIGLPQNDTKSTADALMKKWLGNTQSRSFKNVTIYQGNKLQYAVVHDCLVIATTHSIMEDIIIRNEKNDLLVKQENFGSVREVASSDVPLHFYSRMDANEWLQLDPVFSHEKKMMGGYAVLNNSTTNSFVLTGNGQSFGVADVLPANTSVLDVYSYTDFDTGWKMHESFYAGSNAGKFWGQAWKDLGDTCQCDLNAMLLFWRSGEWGSAVVAVNDSVATEVLFFRTKDSTDVISLMKPLLREQEVTPNHIYGLRYPQLFERNKPQTFLVETNFITQLGEYVFIAATSHDLKSVMNVTTPLAQTSSFKKALNGTGYNSGRFIYQTDYSVSPLPQPLISMLGRNEFVAASVERFKENKYLINIALPYDGKVQAENLPIPVISTDDTIELENSENNSAVSHGPWKVINHNTKQDEKLLQNESNELCLYGNDGKLLWKKALEGNILGDVVQIDALKNNKLQYAFATDKHIYIIDRNGNNLKGFPLKPKLPVQSPLHVADYDKDKKYRLLFTAGDGHIYNYGIDANKTTGWKLPKLSAVYICDFKVKNDDYIMTVSKTGKLSFLKRTGDVRYETSVTLADYNGGKCIVVPGDKISETEITYMTLSGEVKTVMVGK